MVDKQHDNSKAPASDTENHYKELVKFFKNLVWLTIPAITLIFIAGASFLYKDISDMKKEMADVKSEAKEAIANTKDLASLQISNIREQAAKIALDEAQKRVDDAFRSTNVTKLVESAAKNQVGLVIEQQVQKEFDRAFDVIQEDITSLGEIADAAMKARFGFRAGLDKLLKLQNAEINENVRERAKSLVESIAADYEKVAKEGIRLERFPNALRRFKVYSNNKYGEVPEEIAGLIKIIRSEEDLSLLAMAFLALREMTGFPFQIFDFNAIDNWCKDHPTKCNE